MSGLVATRSTPQHRIFAQRIRPFAGPSVPKAEDTPKSATATPPLYRHPTATATGELNRLAVLSECPVDHRGFFRWIISVDEERLKRHDLSDAEWERLAPLLPVHPAAEPPLDQGLPVTGSVLHMLVWRWREKERGPSS